MFLWFFLFINSSLLEQTLLLQGDIDKGLTMLDNLDTPKDYLLSYVLKKYFLDTVEVTDLIMSKKYSNIIYSFLVLTTNFMYDTPENISNFLIEMGRETSKSYLKNGYHYRPKIKYTESVSNPNYLLTMVRGLDASSINTFFNNLDSKKYYLGDHISLLKHLSSKGISRAHGYLGEAYLYGINVNKSVDKALHYFLKGKEGGDSISYNGIGKILMSSEYEDYTGAKQHFEMVNNINETDYYLYLLYRDHFEIEQYSLYYLSRSVSMGYLPAIYEDGIRYFKKGDYESALVRLGAIIDYENTVIYYQEKAYIEYTKGNCKSSLIYLLICIEMGSDSSLYNAIHITSILKLPILKYKLLVKQNTQFNRIGDCFFYGEGVSQSYKDAFSYYLIASTKDTEGLINLHYMYQQGLGVKKSISKAWKTLRRIKVDDHNYLVIGYIHIIFIGKIVVNKYVIVTLLSGLLAYKMYIK